MSEAHKDAFERIRLEHQEVVRLLRDWATAKPGALFHRKDAGSRRPLSVKDVVEGAISNADDAYALLLVATAERFMRAYLLSVGTALSKSDGLDRAISRCVKAFKGRSDQGPIDPEAVRRIRNLRVQRNNYAHGHGSGVFAPVNSVAATLGWFFDRLP